MLKRLTIQNYALIDSLDISFPNGLIIITGETGAGKSILLGAISLLLGKKSDISAILDNSKNCIVEAEFGDDTILRRVITPAGRSRSFLNDEPVSLAELTEISHKIIDIHEQHHHLLLSDTDYQLSILDDFAKNNELLKEYQDSFNQHKSIQSKLTAIKNEIANRNKEIDYKQFLFDELETASLVSGELEELEAEQERLAKAEEIKEALYNVSSLFNPGEISLVQNLKEAYSIVDKYSPVIDGLKTIEDRLASCKIELSDIESEISTIIEDIVVSPERLQVVEDRISLLYKLLKKNDCSTIDELIAFKNELDSYLADNSIVEEQQEKLEKELVEANTKMRDLASKLSKKREEFAPELSKQLQVAVRSLEMPHSNFIVSLEKKDDLNILGGDRLEFLFSANGSANFGPISKVASGGELSRIMLALKSVMSSFAELPTMIFDEIDTGVSGKIADKMGEMIGNMAKNMQIFAITHLPQIASKHGAHFLVYKEFDKEEKAVTNIRLLDNQGRVMELARMLSGSKLTDAAIENAKVLLNL